MRLLVTGASGLVGAQILRLAVPEHVVVGLKRSDLDVADRAEVLRRITAEAPDAVIHCAAYTNVDGAEREPELAMNVNAAGAQWVAEASRQCGARLVHVSTDYVFDGSGASPYDESAPVRPPSSYGRSKLEGERRASAAWASGLTVVRTGWLYGPGKGFVDWARNRLRSGDDVPAVDDQRGSPTYAADLAAALVRLASLPPSGVVHFVNRGVATWLELGRAVASELALDSEKVRPIAASALDRPAPRPAYSALSVERYESVTGATVRGWPDALADYLTSCP